MPQWRRSLSGPEHSVRSARLSSLSGRKSSGTKSQVRSSTPLVFLRAASPVTSPSRRRSSFDRISAAGTPCATHSAVASSQTSRILRSKPIALWPRSLRRSGRTLAVVVHDLHPPGTRRCASLIGRPHGTPPRSRRSRRQLALRNGHRGSRLSRRSSRPRQDTLSGVRPSLLGNSQQAPARSRRARSRAMLRREQHRSPTDPFYAVHPLLLPDVSKRLLHPRDEDSEGLVSYAGGYQDHACVRATLAGPFSQKGLEVSCVGGH